MKTSLLSYYIIVLLSVFLLSCNKEKTIIIQSEALPVNADVGVQPCSEMLQYIQPYKDSLDSQMNTIIAYAPKDLTAGKPQSLLSNFVADLLLQRANELHPTDIAVVNVGGLRSAIPQGDVLVRSIYAVMPFENNFVIVKMQGWAIAELAQNIISVNGEGFAGMKIQVKNGTLAKLSINDADFDKEKTYTLVTSDYLLSGKDGLHALVNHEKLLEPNEKIRDVIMQHVIALHQQKKMVEAKIDDRYVVENY